jgi:hypothetical protein
MHLLSPQCPGQQDLPGTTGQLEQRTPPPIQQGQQYLLFHSILHKEYRRAVGTLRADLDTSGRLLPTISKCKSYYWLLLAIIATQ